MNTNQISELINLMQKNLPFNYLIDIFITMLNDNIIKDAEINNKIITFLLKNCITNNKIDYLITKITNKEKMKIILNQKDLKNKEFSIPTPTIKDFLLNEDSKSIIILKRFIEVGQFDNSEFINEGYGKEMANLLETIKEKFSKYDLTIDECYKILELNEKNNLDSRLNLIFFKQD